MTHARADLVELQWTGMAASPRLGRRLPSPRVLVPDETRSWRRCYLEGCGPQVASAHRSSGRALLALDAGLRIADISGD